MKTEPTMLSDQLINLRSDLVQEYGISIEFQNKIGKAHNCALNFEFPENQSSPKIKQLEWVLESGGWHISMTRFGVSYEIGESKNDGNFILYDILLTTTIHDTIDEAKAAAQADFAKRVMECLDLKEQQKRWKLSR